MVVVLVWGLSDDSPNHNRQGPSRSSLREKPNQLLRLKCWCFMMLNEWLVDPSQVWIMSNLVKSPYFLMNSTHHFALSQHVGENWCRSAIRHAARSTLEFHAPIARSLGYDLLDPNPEAPAGTSGAGWWMTSCPGPWTLACSLALPMHDRLRKR